MKIEIHTPQAIILVLMIVGFAVTCAKSGESRGKYSPTMTALDTLITFSILYWGGFFSN